MWPLAACDVHGQREPLLTVLGDAKTCRHRGPLLLEVRGLAATGQRCSHVVQTAHGGPAARAPVSQSAASGVFGQREPLLSVLGDADTGRQWAPLLTEAGGLAATARRAAVSVNLQEGAIAPWMDSLPTCCWRCRRRCRWHCHGLFAGVRRAQQICQSSPALPSAGCHASTSVLLAAETGVDIAVAFVADLPRLVWPAGVAAGSLALWRR